MSYFKIKEEDVFHNRVKTHPKSNFFIHSGTVYYLQSKETSGSFSATERSVPRGFVSLYELNIDRLHGAAIERGARARHLLDT